MSIQYFLIHAIQKASVILVEQNNQLGTNGLKGAFKGGGVHAFGDVCVTQNRPRESLFPRLSMAHWVFPPSHLGSLIAGARVSNGIQAQSRPG